jgi:hypothetical protein
MHGAMKRQHVVTFQLACDAQMPLPTQPMQPVAVAGGPFDGGQGCPPDAVKRWVAYHLSCAGNAAGLEAALQMYEQLASSAGVWQTQQ